MLLLKPAGMMGFLFEVFLTLIKNVLDSIL